jgi:hypothetical protein
MKVSRKAFVHVGMPKTGTTAVQTALSQSRAQLATVGLIYPGQEIDHVLLVPEFHQAGSSHYYYNQRGELPEQYLPRVQALLDDITGCAKENCSDIIVSSEYLHNLNHSALTCLDRFFADLELEMVVVCVVRHPVDAATSGIQQSVKQGGDKLVELYKNPTWHSARETLKTSIDALGRRRVIAIDFGESQQMGVERFLLQSIGYQKAVNIIETARINEGLSMAAVHLCDAHNELAKAQPLIMHERGYIFSIGGARFQLPAHVADKVRSESQEEVTWLRENFGLVLREPQFSQAPYEDVISSAAAMDLVRLILKL